MQEWRKDGPIGVLIDVINYIKMPQQYVIFDRMQTLAFSEQPTEQQRIIVSDNIMIIVMQLDD
jgi:hypothetical protein